MRRHKPQPPAATPPALTTAPHRPPPLTRQGLARRPQGANTFGCQSVFRLQHNTTPPILALNKAAARNCIFSNRNGHGGHDMRTRHFIMLMTTLLIAITATPAIASGSFNADGKAVVTGIRSRYTSSTANYHTTLMISNTTSCDIECKITLYDQDGNDATSTLLSISKANLSGSPGAVPITSSYGEFTLPAHSTYNAIFQLTTTHRIEGYATIEWRCDTDDIQKALLATSRTIFKTGTSYYCGESQINSEQLF